MRKGNEMPQASDEMRALMDQWFGDPISDAGPMEFLIDQGYADRGGMIVKPNPDHAVTEREWKCIEFMCDEWDYSFDPTLKQQ
jgi:hypothetical protein